MTFRSAPLFISSAALAGAGCLGQEPCALTDVGGVKTITCGGRTLTVKDGAAGTACTVRNGDSASKINAGGDGASATVTGPDDASVTSSRRATTRRAREKPRLRAFARFGGFALVVVAAACAEGAGPAPGGEPYSYAPPPRLPGSNRRPRWRTRPMTSSRA